MDNKLSLKAQLQAMNSGDVMVTYHKRTGIYVAAKRAGWKVSTKDLPNGQIEVTVIEKIVNTPKAKVSEYDAVLNRVKGWTVDTRKSLFEEFELCCAMNRGGCVCPAETVEVPQFAAIVPNSDRLSIDQLKALIAPIATGVSIPQIAQIEEVWLFTSDRPEFTNGRTYRQQYIPNTKRKRTVRVDDDDHDIILEENPKSTTFAA